MQIKLNNLHLPCDHSRSDSKVFEVDILFDITLTPAE